MNKSEHSSGRMSRAVCAALFAALVGACGDQNLFEGVADDNTAAGQVESAKIAIDKGNFTEAIATLQGLCGTRTTAPTCDAETASLLASAFVGRAGVNVFTLIENAAGVIGGSTLDTLSTFSTLLASSGPEDKSDLNDAVELLVSIPTPTRNQHLQVAIAAVAAIVVTVGVDLTDGYDDTTGRPNAFPDQTTIQNAEDTKQTLTQVANDLLLVSHGLDGSGLGNESLRQEIEDLTSAIDTDVDFSVGFVSTLEMFQFLNSL